MARKKIFYGYVMLVCCLVMLVVSTGIVNNCAGQFVAPVCEALDMPRSSMTLDLSFQNFALMLLVPFLGAIYTKIRAPPVRRRRRHGNGGGLRHVVPVPSALAVPGSAACSSAPA